jgi:phosphoglycerate-specific signal transduction histidine kinase
MERIAWEIHDHETKYFAVLQRLGKVGEALEACHQQFWPRLKTVIEENDWNGEDCANWMQIAQLFKRHYQTSRSAYIDYAKWYTDMGIGASSDQIQPIKKLVRDKLLLSRLLNCLQKKDDSGVEAAIQQKRRKRSDEVTKEANALNVQIEATIGIIDTLLKEIGREQVKVTKPTCPSLSTTILTAVIFIAIGISIYYII